MGHLSPGELSITSGLAVDRSELGISGGILETRTLGDISGPIRCQGVNE
jgi:hypothetical protein